tara:strand:- start:49 stop:969 length:921 start_codon:yes stop_codon:yes gene_type:complete
MKKFSIIIPIKNEQDNILEVFERIQKLKLKYTYEIIFVDDGSTDESWGVIKSLNKKYHQVKGISFSKNFGHQIALTAGIDNCNSDFLIMMDGDLQHPPEYINFMIEEYEKGFDVVQMVKENQGKRSIIQKITSTLFYFIFSKISNVNISHNVSDFRLISSKVIDQLKKMKEKERFLRGLVSWVGFKYKELNYKVENRKHGVSKYNILALSKLASFGIFGFSSFPLKVSLYLGYIFAVFSFCYGLFAIIKRFISPERIPVGYTDLIVFITFIGGLILIVLGIIGAYISKIFEEVKNRPIYIIDEKLL